MKSYQYILLDWDGNLARTLEIWLEVSREILHRYDRDLPREDIPFYFHDPLGYVTSLGLPDPEAINEERIQVALERLPTAELYPDALEVLTHLKEAGKELALVTSSPRAAIDHALGRFGLNAVFDATVTGNDITHYKPHPEPLEKALNALGGNKDQAIMIGDASVDIMCANSFGIDSIAFMPPEHAAYYNFDSILEHKPTHTVSDFRKIMELIQ